MNDNNLNTQDVQMTDVGNINNPPEAKPFKKLDSLINSKSESGFLKDLLTKGKVLTSFIKEVKVEDDPDYYLSQSSEYKNLLKTSLNKIEKIISKTFLFTGHGSNTDIKK